MIVADRRALHQIPELDKQLPRTLAYLKSALEGRKCTLFSPGDGALCAWFDFGREEAIAFRADTDALPIQETSGAAYASTIPGQAHACGHDGHMAILLELARRLDGKQTLPHNVLLVFQPAEETTGGARDICRTGIFEEKKVKAIFGLHLWPGEKKGKIFSRPGPLMARSSEVTVDIYGRSAHIAKADQGVDALMAAMEFYRRAVAAEAALPSQVRRLLKFGKFQSGTVRNALSAHSHLEGSLRAYEDAVFEGLREQLYRAAEAVEKTYGCTAELHFSDGYPAVWNEEKLYEKLRASLSFEELSQPCMTAEDFSWYQRTIPGVFFFLGLGDTPALHGENFDFDDSVLVKGADFFEKVAQLENLDRRGGS